MTFDVIFDILRYIYIGTMSLDPLTTKKSTGSFIHIIGVIYYPFISVYSVMAINSAKA
jgi:hypothetical protein